MLNRGQGPDALEDDLELCPDAKDANSNAITNIAELNFTSLAVIARLSPMV
jgi:hypothetical protein